MQFRVPPCCRTLYEEEEQESFHESLAMRIKAHEKDIERMCNKNYQGFIESVGELLKVKSDAMKLKVRVCTYAVSRATFLVCMSIYYLIASEQFTKI